MFPAIDTFASGHLAVSNANEIYWEASGNPRGKPAVHLHGGRGSGIHGRLDFSSPLGTAWNLHKAWPASELIVVDADGHGGQTMAEELIRAIARFSIV
jgi:hypothetical protein